MENLQSPLYDWHVHAGAKLADFGGWQMPIEYPKAITTHSGAEIPAGGVLAEHNAVRTSVGVFDVSHLGKIEVHGISALKFLNRIFTNDLNRIGHGQAQYNLLCDEDGGVIDDVIIYRYDDARFLIIPNAANCSTVYQVLEAANDCGLTITNAHLKYGVLAVQGQLSRKVLEAIGISVELDYMEFATVGEMIICRTGYSGEHGYELIPAWDKTETMWNALVDALSLEGGYVCGLGARDTLRTEMGYPLHGHELSLEISPLQANAGWAVALSKGHMHGFDALTREKQSGVARISRGLKSLDRGIPRAEMNVLDSDGNQVGVVTSGTFSPTLKVGIGLALLDPKIAIGQKLLIDVRGRMSEVEVTRPPFVPSHVR
jgi:aminomethyltransferase